MEADLRSNPKKNDLPTVLILAGGQGTRLRGTIPDVPKPLAPAGGKPFLHYLISRMATWGFNDFVLSLHYEPEKIIGYVRNDLKIPNINVRYFIEPTPLNTGGAILWCANEANLEKPFFTINGDTLLSGNPSVISEDYLVGQIRIGLSEVEDTSRYGKVSVESDKKISGFAEKCSSSPRSGLINAGIYYLEIETLLGLNYKPGDIFSMEKDVFPELLTAKNLYGVKVQGSFIDIGVPSDYLKFKIQVENES